MAGKASPKAKTAKGERAPFERIKFANEIKKLFQRCIDENAEFYCKSENESLFGFKPESYSDKWGLHGQVIVFEEEPKASDQVVVNFSIGPERFFATAEFRPLGGNGILRMVGNLFRLERRGHLRVPLDQALQGDCNIISRGGQTVFIPCEILNISQGGLRLKTALHTKYPPLKMGEKMRFVLHINRRWRLELDGETKHASVDGNHNLCGIEFVQMNDSEKRKLISVMLELQRQYVQSST